MKKIKQIIAGALTLAVLGIAYAQSRSVSVTQAAGAMDVFPSNSRMSFLGKLDNGNIEGTSRAIIKTIFNAANDVYSTTSAQLVSGDTVNIGGQEYPVAYLNVTPPDNEIPLNGLLTSENINVDTAVYSTASGTLKINFTPAADITDGSFEFLIPARDNTIKSNDGVPDSGGYDFNENIADIICPEGDGTYTAWTKLAQSSAVSNVVYGSTHYHRFVCSYTGTSTNNPVEFTITGLINPAPMVHTETEEENRNIGSMDAYTIRGMQVASDGSWPASGNTYVGYGNAVKMTVRVMPQLTYQIEGYSAGAKACVAYDNNGTETASVTTDIDTTGYRVEFGDLSNTYFRNAA